MFLLTAQNESPDDAEMLQLLRMMNRRAQSYACGICGKKGARTRRVTRSYGKGRDLLVIQNVPVISCPHCGESYLTAETLHDIERIKLHRKSFAVKRSVAVADFA